MNKYVKLIYHLLFIYSAEIITGKRGSVNNQMQNDSSAEDSDEDEEENPSWNSTPQFYHGGNNKN